MPRKPTIDSDNAGIIISIRLSPAMIAALDAVAKSENKTRSVLIREILSSKLKDIHIAVIGEL